MHQIETEPAKHAADAAPVALALVDSSLVVQYGNQRWHATVPGASRAGWLSVAAPDDHARLGPELRKAVRSGDPWHGSWIADSARNVVLHGALAPVPGREGELATLSLVDPSEWTQPLLPTEFAGRDSLTGLPTREPFLRALDNASQAGGGIPLAVLFIDLDSLKPVNDEHGHLTGDRVLATIGRALASAVRSDDVAARFGGDEFVVLCRDISMADAAQLARRIHHAAANATPEVRRITASIGIAAGVPPLDSYTLLDAADHAMYRAKRRGPGQTESVVVMADAEARIA